MSDASEESGKHLTAPRTKLLIEEPSGSRAIFPPLVRFHGIAAGRRSAAEGPRRQRKAGPLAEAPDGRGSQRPRRRGGQSLARGGILHISSRFHLFEVAYICGDHKTLNCIFGDPKKATPHPGGLTSNAVGMPMNTTTKGASCGLQTFL